MFLESTSEDLGMWLSDRVLVSEKLGCGSDVEHFSDVLLKALD